MLGRRDLRLLHPLPQRGPLGAAAHVPQADAQLAACRCCCAARTCSATATTRTPSWTGSSTSRPRTAWTCSASSTRSTTSATSRRAMEAVTQHRQARRRAPSATRVSPLHTVDELRRDGRAAAGHGLRLDLHQGHGGAAASRSRPTTSSGASRRPAARTCASTSTCHATTGVTLVSLMKAIEAGADIVDTAISSLSLGPGPQPDREPGRDARGHRLHDPARQGAAAQDQGPLRRRSGRATPSSSPTSSASRPRSSTARSPAA